MSSHNRTRNISGNPGATLIGNRFGPPGDGIPPWLALLIGFCALVLAAAGVWVAAVVALR